MVDLVLRPTGRKNDPNHKWALQLRFAHCGGTEYATLCRIGDDTAREIIKAGAPFWLFGDPDEDGRDDAAHHRGAAPDQDTDETPRHG